MKEIRLHGRGGQGAALAAQMLASAFVAEGKHAASFPMFGFERRGAPVISFVRFDTQVIHEKTQVYAPDCLLVIDPGLQKLPTLYTGLKQNSILLLNSPKAPSAKPGENLKAAGVVNASAIAFEELGRSIANTCLLGSFCAVTNWLKLESLITAFKWYFNGEMLENNIKCATRGYKEVQVIQW